MHYIMMQLLIALCPFQGKTGVPGKKAKPFRSFELQKWEESVYKIFKVGLDNSEVSIASPFQGQGEHCIVLMLSFFLSSERYMYCIQEERDRYGTGHCSGH
jgi:hypothetical protein